MKAPPVITNAQEEWGHFYGLTPEGKVTAAHVIVGKNGKERPPTMRDIKACNVKCDPLTLPDGTKVKYIVKSVTSLFKLMDKAGLKHWVDLKKMLAQEITPRNGMGDDEWLSAINHLAGQKMRDAAELGTRFHAVMEHDADDVDADIHAMVVEARRVEAELDLNIVGREIPFVCKGYPFGGTADIVFKPYGIADYKTRTGLNTYETDVMQQAAYGVGIWGEDFLKHGKGISLIVSTTEPGKALVKHWSTTELQRAWAAFCGLIEIWRLKTNYYL